VRGGCGLPARRADLETGAVYADLACIRACSHAVACAVIRRAIRDGLIDGSVDRGLEDVVANAMWLPQCGPIRYEPSVGTAGE
jgi:hypothetical protein